MTMGWKGVLCLGAAALALNGCDKIMAAAGQKDGTPAAASSGAPVLALSAVATSSAPAAASIDFGDDASKYSKDGECDDKRFAGAGMTDTPLLDSDIKHDASDCRSAFNQGRLTYRGERPSASQETGYATSGVNHIIWGDDASKYAKDGECDDKRFTGTGMTDTPLLDSDIKHDATDCRTAYEQGRLQLKE
jgi:hypothetical protein